MSSNTLSLDDYFFGPVSATYCIWFYILSVFGLIMLFIAVFNFFVSMFTKKIHWAWTGLFAWVGLMWFAMYFQNRLLYNMCMRTEK